MPSEDHVRAWTRRPRSCSHRTCECRNRVVAERSQDHSQRQLEAPGSPLPRVPRLALVLQLAPVRLAQARPLAAAFLSLRVCRRQRSGIGGHPLVGWSGADFGVGPSRPSSACSCPVEPCRPSSARKLADSVGSSDTRHCEPICRPGLVMSCVQPRVMHWHAVGPADEISAVLSVSGQFSR